MAVAQARLLHMGLHLHSMSLTVLGGEKAFQTRVLICVTEQIQQLCFSRVA